MTIDEKEKIRRVFPDNKIVIAINPENQPTESTLSSAEWQVISRVNGKKNLQEIIDELSFEEDECLRVLYSLYEKKIVGVNLDKKTQQEFVSAEFFEKLEKVLTKVIGPVSVYVIDDVLWDLDEKRDEFIAARIPVLIESVSREIPDEKKMVQFQKEMLDIIKNYEIS
jgi:hypothetical protein